MPTQDTTIARDRARLDDLLESVPNSESVIRFKPGPGIQKLDIRFDIDRLRGAYFEAEALASDLGVGISAIALTRRPGDRAASANDLSGRYYIRGDASYREEAREDRVDESAFTEFLPALRGSYFEHVHRTLVARFPIGRVRVLAKAPFSCNSWHRDPEPRLHIPIITNPGSLFIVNHHCTHLPADGSVYFTDTRGYHTALNGGDELRVHVVAALPGKTPTATDA